jgi:curved DNA-binding protein CbpA
VLLTRGAPCNILSLAHEWRQYESLHCAWRFRQADEETIRSAYRILARRYHPDRGAGSSAEKFRQINDAYEILIDPGRRQAYDLSLQRAELPVAVRLEPTRARPRFIRQEDAAVFGRFEEPIDLLDELFFASDWPW